MVGKAVFTVEALSLGGGYIIEPCYVDIIEGENAAQALARLLEERGFTYSNTGSLESGFYLSHIQGDALAGIDPTGDSIPQALREKLEEKNFDIQTRTDETSLGEFDYTSASGWMYCPSSVCSSTPRAMQPSISGPESRKACREKIPQAQRG